MRPAEHHLPSSSTTVATPSRRRSTTGPKNWNYTALVDAIHNGDGRCWTAKVTCEEELAAAIDRDCLCFIEVVAHKDDTSKELLQWGSRVCAANSRPPNPQW
ncbi:hypothetical protein U9M48_016308 [Paspalum notatum var. saurae]|uniref:pyruvate decarboxylase n=1 Tax=Paspalum notatum var. saurae TaxID=547442 RepID=A0AAQ3T550_PASNO